MEAYWSSILRKNNSFVAYNPLQNLINLIKKKYMEKSICKIVIVFLFLFFLSPIYALDFSSLEPEELVFENTYDNWVEDAGYQPSIVYLNNTYHMFHTTVSDQYRTQKLGYATSSDGLHWKKIKLYDFGLTENIHSPSILMQNEHYILTFGVDTYPNKIMSVESSNIDQFEASTLKEIIRASDSSEGITISDPNEFIDNNNTKLWYVANNGSGWRIHLAYFEDNIWKKCTNNPIFSDSGLGSLSFFQYEGISYLFFHSSEGIEYIKSSDHISCSTVWSIKTNIISSSAYFPNLILRNGTIYLYYNVFEDGKRTMVKAPLYKELRKKSIIIVPGLFASWNKEAILHQKEVSYSDWKLNPFVTEYSGIENTLINLGYKKNENFYIFPYDWRKPLEKSADDLSAFIKAKPTPSFGSWNIVGHSLGGLVGKIAIQKNNDFETDNLITVGSPHLGAAQTYKPLSGGEIERENTFMWLAEKVIITLYKSKIESDRVTIASHIPSLRDLLPIYNYLFDENGVPTPYNNMFLVNTTLNKYSNTSFNRPVQLTTISGKEYDTPFGFTIIKPSIFYSLLGNYKDGQPIKTLFKSGDKTVLSESSSLRNTNNIALSNLNHGEIITSKTGIKSVLDRFNITYSDEKISEGKQTVLSPSIIFLIRSPAVMQVTHNEKIFDEADGMIFIPNAENGLYKLKVKGIENGVYKVTVGQISETDDIWDTFDGTINNSNPSDQIDSYTIDFNTTKLISVLTPIPTPSVKTEKTSELTISCTNSHFDVILKLKNEGNKIDNIKVNFTYLNTTKTSYTNSEGVAIAGFIYDSENDISVTPENGFLRKKIHISKNNCKEQIVKNDNISNILKSDNLQSSRVISQNTLKSNNNTTSQNKNLAELQSSTKVSKEYVLGADTKNNKQIIFIIIKIVSIIILGTLTLIRRRIYNISSASFKTLTKFIKSRFT